MHFINKILFIFVVGIPSAFAGNGKNLKFQLEWIYKNVPLTMKLAEAPSDVSARVGETGVVDNLHGFQVLQTVDNDAFDVPGNSTKYFYLTAKNTTDKEIVFSVAPHETNPVEFSLGFAFHCLCNGHIYRVPPGKYWYRIIELINQGIQSTDQVIHLKHTVFAVSEKAKK